MENPLPIHFFQCLLLIILALSACEDNHSDNLPADIETPENKNIILNTYISGLLFQNDTLWVGSSEGVYKIYDTNKTNYTLSDGLPNDFIISLHIDKENRLWIGTESGLGYLANNRFEQLLGNEYSEKYPIYSITSDSSNNLYFGSRGSKFIRYKNDSFEEFDIVTDSTSAIHAGHIHIIKFDSYKTLWVGSCATGLSKMENGKWSHHINDIESFARVSLLVNDELWIGHALGISRLKDEIWTDYTIADGLADNQASCICSDSFGNIWIGTNSGVSRFDGDIWENYDTSDGLTSQYPTAIACGNEGNLWIGSYEGLITLKLN